MSLIKKRQEKGGEATAVGVDGINKDRKEEHHCKQFSFTEN